MTKAQLLQEIRKMRFEEAYDGWDSGCLTFLFRGIVWQ